MMQYWLNTLILLLNELTVNLFDNWSIASGITIGGVILYSFIATLIIRFVFNLRIGSGLFKSSFDEKLSNAENHGFLRGWDKGFYEGTTRR